MKGKKEAEKRHKVRHKRHEEREKNLRASLDATDYKQGGKREPTSLRSSSFMCCFDDNNF